MFSVKVFPVFECALRYFIVTLLYESMFSLISLFLTYQLAGTSGTVEWNWRYREHPGLFLMSKIMFSKFYH